ncbi:Alpha-galactosidase [Lactiplantibacillus plantarum]|nr:Alpha-galactosidase [Lactiplantibacillus plantarum]
MAVTLQQTLIDIDEEQLVFHLHNDQISYILGVETGNVLAHLYFGPRVRGYHGERQYPRIDRGFSGNLPNTTDRSYSKDDLPQEYGGNNTGDYRQPAAIIRAANGARTVDFLVIKTAGWKPVSRNLRACHKLMSKMRMKPKL